MSCNEQNGALLSSASTPNQIVECLTATTTSKTTVINHTTSSSKMGETDSEEALGSSEIHAALLPRPTRSDDGGTSPPLQTKLQGTSGVAVKKERGDHCYRDTILFAPNDGNTHHSSFAAQNQSSMSSFSISIGDLSSAPVDGSSSFIMSNHDGDHNENECVEEYDDFCFSESGLREEGCPASANRGGGILEEADDDDEAIDGGEDEQYSSSRVYASIERKSHPFFIPGITGKPRCLQDSTTTRTTFSNSTSNTNKKKVKQNLDSSSHDHHVDSSYSSSCFSENNDSGHLGALPSSNASASKRDLTPPPTTSPDRSAGVGGVQTDTTSEEMKSTSSSRKSSGKKSKKKSQKEKKEKKSKKKKDDKKKSIDKNDDG